MRVIKATMITEEVARLCQEANFFLGQDVLKEIEQAKEIEESPLGQEVLDQLIENAMIARRERVPICQDTGFIVIFLEIGQDIHISGNLREAVEEGVRLGSRQGYLRNSIVAHPFRRINTGDNTPAIIHTEMVPGEQLKIIVAPKGGGSENMSQQKMLKPLAGQEGVKDFVLQVIEAAGANPCPPIVVGIGIGGTFEKVAYLAKKALLRALNTPHSDPLIAELERDLYLTINQLGIGPAGFGGRTTALAVHIEIFPCHIASLPVAVNLNCHAARHKTAIL